MHFDDRVHIWPPPGSHPDQVRQLYVHIPFCPQLCHFCTFHRVRFQADRAQIYFQALRHELAWYHDRGFRFTDLYVGGGTPTVLPEELISLLNYIRALFPVTLISVETNPSDLTDKVLDALQEVGVARLSVGVQSFDDELLKHMGRYHAYGSSKEIRTRLNNARDRFQTLNVDMIFNLPRQTRTSLESDIHILTEEHGIDQVSYYPLMVAPVAQRAISAQMGAVITAQEREFYELIRSGLSRDYAPSTVWCFSREPAMIDEYLVNHDDYVGVGSGAFSYLGGVTASTTFSIRGYIKQAGADRSPIVRTRRLNAVERMRYDFLVKLFGLNLDIDVIEAKHQGRFQKTLWKEILSLRLIGALRDTGDRLEVTDSGMYLWLVMMREFLNSVNMLRAIMRHEIRDELRSLGTLSGAAPEEVV